MSRVSSLDSGYQTGDLSLFPENIDDRTNLYQASNNASTALKFGLPFNGKKIIVDNASAFPSQGLLRIGPIEGEGNSELIYYGSRTDTTFNELYRGFAGSVQTSWSSGAYVTNSIMAEHHNAIKDAVLNIQRYLGTKYNPDVNSLHGIIRQLENRYLAPKALFRAFPKIGLPPLKVRFQNLSGGNTIRFLWDFGDGVTSIERNPSHIYQAEGFYTVKLSIYTSAGGQGISQKNNYIKVSEEEMVPFFYIVQTNAPSPAYSIETATLLGKDPAVFSFVDQTDGNILRRIWVFGDGETEENDDPDKHTTTHTYNSPGEYSSSLLIVYTDQTVKRASQEDSLIIL